MKPRREFIVPPGWSSDFPTESGVYDFLGVYEGRSGPYPREVPGRARIFIPPDRTELQSVTYDGDLANKHKFHGVWRKVEPTEAELDYLVRRLLEAFAKAAQHRLGEYPWRSTVSSYDLRWLGIPDFDSERCIVGRRCMTRLLGLDALQEAPPVDGSPQWFLTQHGPEKIQEWLDREEE